MEWQRWAPSGRWVQAGRWWVRGLHVASVPHPAAGAGSAFLCHPRNCTGPIAVQRKGVLEARGLGPVPNGKNKSVCEGSCILKGAGSCF